MYCPSCGSALSRQMKYCTRCGAQTNQQEIKPVEKRLDEYHEGLFWITVFGLGVILGGAFLASILAEKLHLGRWLVIAYLALSSAAFLINFCLNLRETLRLSKSLKQRDGAAMASPRDTNKMLPAEGAAPVESPQSVIENTTRSLEPISLEQAAKE
jgi:hypothetical protein